MRFEAENEIIRGKNVSRKFVEMSVFLPLTLGPCLSHPSSYVQAVNLKAFMVIEYGCISTLCYIIST